METSASNRLEFIVRGVLLDIEGTTSSIDFVHHEMFPFARRELAAFLGENWQRPDVRNACERLAQDAGLKSLDSSQAVIAEVNRLMDTDAKTTGLKQLQGLIWKSGFESGQLQAHLYGEVAGVLRQWRQHGLDIRIYSSGSIGAQKLFFSHTVAGNLLPLVSDHYDTTTGAKQEPDSYLAIAADWQLKAAEILFLSDVPAELDAAKEAGMQAAISIRPGNAPIEGTADHPAIHSFNELTLVVPK